MYTTLMTVIQRNTLLENGEIMERDPDLNILPVIKLFTPDAQFTWLLVSIYPHQTDIAFGLCDLGFGSPELGDVSLREISELRGPLDLPVERDRFWRINGTIGEYASMARREQRIVNL